MPLLSMYAWSLSMVSAQLPAAPQIVKHDPPLPPSSAPCTPDAPDLCTPLDNTFAVVTFDGVGGNGPASPSDRCQRNDDDVTLAIDLQFTFDLFGQSWHQVFINNNGNISFGSDFSTFTSTGFPVNGFPMVAPFWGDVDTRDPGSGVVYYKSEAHRFTVIWDHVGYYGMHSDKRNTFEVSISDGTDPNVGIGNNVCFCYSDMQWTTGDASGGSGGFGGTPATVGVNAGDGVNFFQIGRFGVAGNAYDGPGGNTDGIDYLDHTSYCFFAGQTGSNVAPVFLNPPNDCLQVAVGQPLQFDVQAIGPETGQTVTLAVNANGLAGFSSTQTAGNPAVSQCSFTPVCTQVGRHDVVFTATDDFTPPASSQLTVCIEVLSPALELCFGDGPANGGPDCPCQNSTPGGTSGCVHSGGASAHLAGGGCPSISQDTLTLTATGLVPNKPTFFFASAASAGGGAGTPSADGLACLGATRKRIGKISRAPATGGPVTVPLPGDAALSIQFPAQVGQTHYYQVFFRDPSGPCGQGANSTNAVSVVWVQ